MCGIAGFTGENRELIERMTAALVHRGPDGDAIVVTHGASLGHARLAILDPTPAGDQPMWNDDRDTVIVYNGEIFNYRELRDAHRLDCKTGTDTEVILKLYQKLGIGFVRELRGMFAFGLYDIQKSTWHLARDPSGIKPLFVSYPHGKLHFASEMRSLMKALPSKPAINQESLSHYMRLQYVPGPDTLCEGISSLPPGTVLTSTPHGERRDVLQADVSAIHSKTPGDFRKSFPTLMDRVVRDHLISDKPIGIFLSGGMDSSIVLHHMAANSVQPVRTFTVRFDATEEEDAMRFNRDADLAKLTAKHYATDHHEITVTAEMCRAVYRDSAMAMDQPNADSVSIAQFALAKEAKRSVDVVLCGAGGDELFGGYPRYRVAKILAALGSVPPSLRRKVARILGYPQDVLSMHPGPELAQRLLCRPLNEIESIATGTWFQKTCTQALLDERFEKLHLHGDPVREFMEFDRKLWLVDESLRLTDAMTMASGLECRVPFLDPLIIEASHGTKANWHVSLQKTKKLLKETYRPILPSHLFSLKKASFYPPLAKWLRRECSPLIDEALSSKRIAEYFDVTALRTIADKHRSKEKYNLHILSNIIQLAFWFETVYDA